ncbi:hypothetical protein TIFTF001_009606 [Ficus carica]|uniref:Uncharacterized protein n=1 Tax=Ficus carica TaxID=3494 RepID=A0AA87ZWR2_FICCA|nr:hypothetical protein TIFTF001_009606 [Ficus carica]
MFNGTIKLEMAQRLRNLISLDLSYNSLSVGTSGNHSSWSSFSKISRLMLASCHLTVFPNLKNQSKLVYLDLSDNEIHGKVPNWIWEVGNGSLIYLNLSRNYLEGMQEPYKLPSFLTTLDLHSNHMQGKIPALP